MRRRRTKIMEDRFRGAEQCWDDQRTGPARQVERAAGAPIHAGNKKKTRLCRAQRVQPKVCSHRKRCAAQFYLEMAFEKCSLRWNFLSRHRLSRCNFPQEHAAERLSLSAPRTLAIIAMRLKRSHCS